MARGFIRCTVIGTVTKDPEMRYLQSGQAVLNLSLAVNESYTDKNSGEKREDVTWVKVAVWGNLAEAISAYVHKGSQIFVAGKPKARAWAGAEGPMADLDVNARDVLLLGSKRDNGERDEFAPNEDISDIPF